MNYLITGGAGFIGSHLCECLIEKGHKVVAIDDLSTGSINNLKKVRSSASFKYHIDSVFNRELLGELVDESDAIFHLAAAVGVRLIVESPVRTIETNVKATELVLEMANKKKRRVLVTSTSEVYGKSAATPFREDGDLVLGCPTLARWSYACSKALDEFLAIAYWREKRCPTIIARLFNTVGPRQTGRYGMVLPTFVSQALGNRPITVFGDGNQTRSFTHVEDAVAGLVAIMEAPGAVGGIFNIGSANEISIMDLAKCVKSRTGSSSVIKLVSYDAAYGDGFEDMPRRIPDNSKIRDLVGWSAQRSTDEVIDDVIEYQRTFVEA